VDRVLQREKIKESHIMKTLTLILLLLLTGVCYAQPLTFKVTKAIRNFPTFSATSLVNEPNCVYSMGSKIGNTVVDISGNSNTGTAVGGVINAGGIENALQFNGTSAYVSVASSSTLNFGTGDFSIELNVKLNTLTAEWLFSKYFAPNGFHCFTNASGVLFFTLGDGTATAYNTGATISAGVNYHIVFSLARSTTLKTYINGVLSGTNDISLKSGTVNNSAILSIAGYNGSSDFYKCNLYSFKLYNKALSQSEVTAKWNAIAKQVYLREDFSQYAVGSFPREWVKVSGTFAVTQISVAEGRLLKNDKYLLASAGGSIYTSATGNISNYYITYELYTGGSWVAKSGVVSTVSTAEASFDYSTTTNRITFILATNERVARIKIIKGTVL
jgi:hypothetical protein